MDKISMLRVFTQPGVITRSMLVSLATDQAPKGEAGRLFVQDGIDLNNLEEIRIEFLNILNIDHLWILKNLVKLTLSHNIIEKIESLDELVHLRELDLSFNYIKVIENLNTLTQLEILLLYNNEISIVQGIDNLKKLIILNIGKNKIADWEHVIYLRNFKTLRSLNTSENPCTKINGYLDYLFAFVPQLHYYQYKMISESTRQSAIDKHHRAISSLEENEIKLQTELALQKEAEDKLVLLSNAYIEYLDGDSLFQQMFSLDEEGKILSTINEDARNAFEEYRKPFSGICQELYDLGMQEHSKRTEEIELFRIAVDEGKNNIKSESRRTVNEVLGRKIEIFENIQKLTETLVKESEDDATDEIAAKARVLFNEFNDLLFKARNELMSKEVTLHDQIKDVNEVFRINIIDIVNSFTETARAYFSQLRNAEAEYNDIINGIVLYYLSGFGDEATVPTYLLNICGDKDTLTNTLAGSHDTHLQVIDDREDSMINRLNDWLKKYTDQLVIDENQRNRQHILEISHFFETQQEEFNSLELSQQLDLVDIDLDETAIM